MSYRSLKRRLGESSLERKCLFLFGGYLLLLISGSFWLYGRQTETLLDDQNPRNGEKLVDTILLLTHWEKLEEKEEFQSFVQILGSNLIHRWEEYEWEFIRRDGTRHTPIRGEEETNKPRSSPRLTSFEEEVLTKYIQMEYVDDGTKFEGPFPQQYVDSRKIFEYYQPVYATHKRCVDCHKLMFNQPDLKDGELISVVKVRASNEKTLQAMSLNRAILLVTAIVTVCLAMFASYLIVRYVIVKPLRHLRDVSDAVSHGELQQRAEIHTGDEFEDMGVAFNRMLRHLINAQEELRRVNRDLDGKVDELAQANMQLFEMNRLKSDFLATMSHELRTPLNSIIGFSDVLGSIRSLDDKQRRYVQNIQKSGKMLLDMINDILDLAKIESGRMEVRLSDFRIEHVIHAQCDMARPLTEKKNIDLEVEVQPQLPQMHQDQGKVQQILNNLLSNAIKYTPEGGRIRVKARTAPSGDMELIVADTGIGIAEEDQTIIFEKFRQGKTGMPGENAMTREYSGTGLGLSIVKELCKLLGGEISLHSELGKGSTFIATIPWVLNEWPRRSTPLSEAVDDLTRPRRTDFERSEGPPLTDTAAGVK